MAHYPKWKIILFFTVSILGLIYALPNLYGEDPAVQISAQSGYQITPELVEQLHATLEEQQLAYYPFEQPNDKSLLIRFKAVDKQLSAKDMIKATVGDNYTVALNLAPATPTWLRTLGAEPMKLGLDLRGGVHFLLAIDVDSLLKRRLEGNLRGIRDTLRTEKIRYLSLRLATNEEGQLYIDLRLRNQDDANKAKRLIHKQYPELTSQVDFSTEQADNSLGFTFTVGALNDARNYAVEQSMTILRNRINELGVAEPIVQRQGIDRIAVDLPGVQDTARAKQILGGTATVQMHLVDTQNDPIQVMQSGKLPLNSTLYDYEGRPVLLDNTVILSGTSITGASSTISQNGSPAVDIRLGGGGEAHFYRVTKDNIGNAMAILFVETKLKPELDNGDVVFTPEVSKRVISVATIRAALGNTFIIEGLSDMGEARNLALLLRAGALPTPITIIEESTVGPSLGKDNIEKGVVSVEIGFCLIVAFMLFYYRLFGLCANLVLLINLVLLMAALSAIDATLTLPGIAGILLTLGMAVDANVLIFERIREELRNGMSPHASIAAGFERALATIVDSNVTTLIAALALFTLGTGAVKGFAVTLTIGLLISMFTAITGTRSLVQLIYGRRNVKRLSIGI